MSIASIERRVSRLEGQGSPPGGLFFLLWAASSVGVEARRAELERSGELGPSDVVVAAVWSGTGVAPPSRWIEPGGLAARELEALMAAVERIATTEAGLGIGSMLAVKLSNEALIGIALGEGLKSEGR